MVIENKTALGLVEHCKKALREHWWYMWGTYGNVLTLSLLSLKIKQYPKYNNYALHSPHIGETVSDCIGLIKGYCMKDEETGKIKYDVRYDKNTGGMYKLATEKGVISSIPDIPGICVYMKGHIGVYVGEGKVIECAGGKGVIETPLKNGTAWTHWLKCPFISYDDPSEPQNEFPAHVRVKQGAKDYNGRQLSSWVYNRSFDVLEYSKDRVVIGIGSKVTAAVNIKDIEKV